MESKGTSEGTYSKQYTGFRAYMISRAEQKRDRVSKIKAL
jgi:hypothetical protein